MEVVDFLRDEYNIQIQLDIRALDDLGMSSDDPVSVNLRGISLESALDLMLQQLELTYIVDDEVMLITNKDVAAERMETRVYPVFHPDLSLEATTELLHRTVAPDSWTETGGAGDVAILGNKLIVRQTYAVHREINKLLSQLQRDAATGTVDDSRYQ